MQWYTIARYGKGCIKTIDGKHHIEQDPDSDELSCRMCGWWTNDKDVIKEILNSTGI